jgi:hypothetical protein
LYLLFALIVLVISGFWWTFSLGSGRMFSAADAISAPTMGTVALVFGLFVTFSTSDANQRSRELRLSAQKEASVARSILSFCDSIGTPAGLLREAVVEYLQAATTSELKWLEQSKESYAASVQDFADDLVQIATSFANQSKTPEAI